MWLVTQKNMRLRQISQIPRPKGSSLVDHRGVVQCFQLGGWLEEVPPRQNRCILQQLAERRLADWSQAVTCFEGNPPPESPEVATCSFCWIIWGTDWMIAPRLERNPRLGVITKASLRESCGEDGLKISWSGWWLKMVGILSFEMFWSMWDVSISNLHVLCCDCHLHGN